MPVATASASQAAPRGFENVSVIVSSPSSTSSSCTATRTVFADSPGANTSVSLFAV